MWIPWAIPRWSCLVPVQVPPKSTKKKTIGSESWGLNHSDTVHLHITWICWMMFIVYPPLFIHRLSTIVYPPFIHYCLSIICCPLVHPPFGISWDHNSLVGRSEKSFPSSETATRDPGLLMTSHPRWKSQGFREFLVVSPYPGCFMECQNSWNLPTSWNLPKIEETVNYQILSFWVWPSLFLRTSIVFLGRLDCQAASKAVSSSGLAEKPKSWRWRAVLIRANTSVRPHKFLGILKEYKFPPPLNFTFNWEDQQGY